MGRYAAAVAVMLVMSSAPLHAQDAVFVVTMTSADIHKAPSTGSAVIGKAPRGKAFEVRRELGSWVSIAWPDADIGVAYLHVAWGKISRGAAVEVQRVSDAALSTTAPASTPALSTKAVASTPATSPTPGRVAQPQGLSTRPRSVVSLPSHVVGVGGGLGTRAIGVALAGRAWALGPLGVQIEASQSTYTSAVAPGQLKAMQLAPAVMYALPSLVTNALWARPYVGAGLNMFRSTLRGTPGVADSVHNTFGSQVFGGAEFTWANLPQLTLSADVRQRWPPPNFSGFDLGGRGVSLSAHWYVK